MHLLNFYFNIFYLIFTSKQPSVVLSTPLSTLCLHNDMPLLPPSINEGSYVMSDYVFT